MRLNGIHDNPGSSKKRMRIGRGIGSGMGKQGGRGGKGQTARSGVRIKGFEGGQMPLHRRLPKRGFTSLSRRYVEVVRLTELEKLGADEIDLMVLKQAGIIGTHAIDARVIASGEIKRQVTVRGIGVTAGAKKAIEGAGGTVVVIEKPAPVKKLPAKIK